MEYPKDYRDLIKRFGTQDACLDYIESIRWKDAFTCSVDERRVAEGLSFTEWLRPQ